MSSYIFPDVVEFPFRKNKFKSEISFYLPAEPDTDSPEEAELVAGSIWSEKDGWTEMSTALVSNLNLVPEFCQALADALRAKWATEQEEDF